MDVNTEEPRQVDVGVEEQRDTDILTFTISSMKPWNVGRCARCRLSTDTASRPSHCPARTNVLSFYRTLHQLGFMWKHTLPFTVTSSSDIPTLASVASMCRSPNLRWLCLQEPFSRDMLLNAVFRACGWIQTKKKHKQIPSFELMWSMWSFHCSLNMKSSHKPNGFFCFACSGSEPDYLIIL